MTAMTGSGVDQERSTASTTDAAQSESRQKSRAAYAALVLAHAKTLKAINNACFIIEAADARNLANDGPAGGFPPQMTLAEWRKLYVMLDKARQG